MPVGHTIGKAPAFPSTLSLPENFGLTKREYFAAMAMQGLLASETKEDDFVPQEVAKRCTKFADALIDALTDETITGEQR